MKKILLLLCTVALIACSKDDENIQYDNEKGYLTNLESVKFGIVGTWKFALSFCNDCYLAHEFNINNEHIKHQHFLPSDSDVYFDEYRYYSYKIEEEDGSFFVISTPLNSDYWGERQKILILNKTYIHLDDLVGHKVIYTRQ
ncbi:MAG: hypothetical protein LBJ63_08040 [Prevotellaceae bacterium]|nr:hypothetical protein [Prevotellaceae bacterium]